MLLWHDSLDYKPLFFGSTYPGSIGIFPDSAHEVSGRKGLASQAGQFSLPLTPSSDTCILGFLYNLDVASAPTDGQTLLEFNSIGNLPKLKAVLRTSADGFKIQFQRAAGGEFLLVTRTLPYSTWLFLEFRVVFQDSQGSIVVRVDGVESDRVENVTTDPNTLVGWGTLIFHLRAASTGLARMADLYVCDSSGASKTHRTFLGKVLSSRLFPYVLQTDPFGWGVNPGGKYRLICILGQSNAQGNGRVPWAGQTWRNPNPYLPIWNARTQAFEPLEAGANATGIITQGNASYADRFGAEMAFAEEIALLCERSGVASPGNYRLVKSAQDGSTVLAGYPDFITWDPSTTNSLYQITVTELGNAIAALGGISNIESIDYFWYQGESEGLLNIGLLPFPGDYFTQTFVILIGLANLFPVPSRVHIIKIHKSIPEYSNNQGEIVRSRQSLVYSLLGVATGAFLDIDHLVTGPDHLHLSELSLDHLGIQMFQDWIEFQDYGKFLTDEFFTSYDAKWIGSNSAGTSASFIPAIYNQLGMIHSPVLAATSRTYSESSSDGKHLAVDVGKIRLSDTAIPTASAWTLGRSQNAGIFSPEDITETITLSLL